MEYQVGSLADAIFGSNEVSASKTRILFVPKTSEPVKSKKRTSKEFDVSPSVSPSPNKRKKVSFSNDTNEVEIPRNDSSVNGEENRNTFSSRVKQRENRTRKKKKQGKGAFKLKPVEPNETSLDTIDREELENRTIHLKNLPNTVDKKSLKKLFKKYGKIECVRFRCAVGDNPKMRKRQVVILKQFHPQRSNITAFIRFESLDSVEEALKANGLEIDGHHIFIDRAVHSKNKFSNKKAIYIGNLPYDVEEDDLYELFKDCGEIVDIRIVRDRNTGIGKGFAYVNFKSCDGVELALSLGDLTLKERQLRVSRSEPNKSKKRMQQGFKNTNGKSQRNQGLKRVKMRKTKGNKNKGDTENSRKEKKTSTIVPTAKSNVDFQGHTSDQKKKQKKKPSKDELKRKAVAKILTSSKKKKV